MLRIHERVSFFRSHNTMELLAKTLLFVLDVYFWVIIASVVISWLVAFEVFNASNPQARNIINLLEKLTEPVYRPLRKYIPVIGGIDISPIIVIFALYLLKDLAVRLLM